MPFFPTNRTLRIALAIVMLLTCVSVAEEPAPGATPGQAVIDGFRVEKRTSDVRIEVFGISVPACPRTERLGNPNRLVFDFPDALPRTGFARQSVNTAAVSGVRMALWKDGGAPITRVVIDLSRATSYATEFRNGIFAINVANTEGQVLTPASSKGCSPYGSTSAGNSSVTANSRTKPVAPIVKPVAFREPNIITKGANSLRRIDVGQSGVSLVFDQVVNPRLMNLKDPSRLVIDFPGVASGPAPFPSPAGVAGLPIRSIRNSLYQRDPDLYRVVLELSNDAARPWIQADGARVQVQFGSIGDRMQTAATPAPTPASEPQSSLRAQPPVAATTTPPSSTTAAPTPQHAPVPLIATPISAPRPPKIGYNNGLLSIETTNSNLADVIYAVAEKTGAAVQMPFADGMLDRVTLTMGPGKPQEVIGTLLQGSCYNYFLVEDSGGKLQKLVLTPK